MIRWLALGVALLVSVGALAIVVFLVRQPAPEPPPSLRPRDRLLVPRELPAPSAREPRLDISEEDARRAFEQELGALLAKKPKPAGAPSAPAPASPSPAAPNRARSFPADAPPLPLPPEPADPARLARAREVLGEAARVGSLGPYTLLTDLPADADLTFFANAVASVEPVYRQRTGLAPLGQPVETVLLFAREAEYRRYEQQEARLAGSTTARGHTARGLVVLYLSHQSHQSHQGEDSEAQVASTLVHEVVHLLNRRALGPALPSWLDEGLAEDFALARLSPAGRLEPGTWSGGRREVAATATEVQYQVEGGEAAVLLVSRELAQLPSLPALLAMDWQRFARGTGSERHYAMAGLWVRYLLSAENGALAPGFRAYLAAVARGESAEPAALERHLGRDLRRLGAGFRAWVGLQGLGR